MTQLNNWATRHGVSPRALDELKAIMTQPNTEPSRIITGVSEAAVQNAVRLEAANVGCRLWRNNVGACEDKRGRQIRYGLCNDSSKMNGHIKSSDLIGIKPVLILPTMVGSTIGQFVAREVKKGKWSYKATEREVAQLRFLELVTALGGDACFANGRGTL
jgi:hypothetical protein